jgi:hypothetical protein
MVVINTIRERCILLEIDEMQQQETVQGTSLRGNEKRSHPHQVFNTCVILPKGGGDGR